MSSPRRLISLRLTQAADTSSETPDPMLENVFMRYSIEHGIYSAHKS